MKSPKTLTFALLAVLLLVVPTIGLAAGGGYVFRIATTICVFAILTLSANLITGTTGLLSLGHAAFYGIGAYAAALLGTALHWPVWLTIPVAGIVTACAGILLALPTMRLVGIYFAVATLGVGEIIHVTLLNWVGFTRGPMGITGIPALNLPGLPANSDMAAYLVTALCLAVTVAVVHRLSHSYFGNALRAVREDDQCAEAMGLNVVRLKVQVFGFSCFFAGVAGALWAHSTGYVSPADFRFSESILILSMIVVGGLGSLPGAIIGAALLIGLPELMRPIGDFRMIVVGLVMFLSIMFRPKGLFGEVSAIELVRKRFGAAWRASDTLGWR